MRMVRIVRLETERHMKHTPASAIRGEIMPEPGDPRHAAYWRANLRLAAILLTIWFVVSFGFGILLVEPLNRIPLFGFKLGFWWAQQGSIYVFIVLIFVYARRMKTLDRQYGVDDDTRER
jgi:putative solute:sodium symporter small subunit